MDKKIRILSLDGGGSHCGILARALRELYPKKTGREILRKFDFVAGNSGGSIVLAALCCDYTPHDIEVFYRDPATLRRLFSPKWVWWIPLLRCVLPRYSSRGKFEGLKYVFDQNRQPNERSPSTIPLEEWKNYLKSDVNLIVPAFDYDQERATFFRSNTGSLAKSSSAAAKATLVEAVHASTNAPIRFYDKPAEVGGRRYWDGALGGYNNPVLAAVVEALANRPGEADKIRVLSIGTGTSSRPPASDKAPPPLGKVPDSTCLYAAVKKAGTVILDDPPDAATFHAHVALRQAMPKPKETSAGNVVRLCPLIRPIWIPTSGVWDLPPGLTEGQFEDLIEMPLDAMRESQLTLIWRMCELWIAGEIRNQPIRMGEGMHCDIGHETFGEAKAHWERIAA